MNAVIKTVLCSHKKVYMYLHIYPDCVKRILKVDSKSMRVYLNLEQRNTTVLSRDGKTMEEIVRNARYELRTLLQSVIRTRESNKPAKERAHNESKNVAKTPAKSAEPEQNIQEFSNDKNGSSNKIGWKKKEKQRSRYTGRLLAFGIAKRTLNKKTFDQFRVILAADELEGHPQEIWGAELEKVIKDSQVNIGDHLQIVHLGTMPVNVKEEGETVVKHRNAYSITASLQH